MKKFFSGIIKAILVLFIVLNIIAIFQANKLTHFYDNVPKPDTQTQNWTATQKFEAAVFGIKSPKSKNLIVPDSAYQTDTIVTADGLHLEAWHLVHINNSKGTVILFHGHGSNKSAILPEGYSFYNMGYNVLLVDFRAHGGSEGNICTIGINESKDVKAAYDFIAGSGEKNIVLWGISLGAATIIHAVAEFNIKPNKLILEMPFGTLSDAVSGKMRMMGLHPQPIGTLLTFWGGVEHGLWAFDMKPVEFAKKIDCPVLLQWGKKDPRVTEKEIDDIYNNISTSKKLVIYDNSAHESLCKKENTKWITEVSSFLQ